MQNPVSDHKAYLEFGVRLALGLAIVAALFAIVDTTAVLSALHSIAPTWFLGALLINILGSVVGPAITTSQALAAGNRRIPLAELIRINFAMRFYVLTLPHAITIGMRWARYKNKRDGLGWEAAALLLFERTIQFNVIITFAFIFLARSYVNLPDQFRFLMPVSALLILLGYFICLLFVSRTVYSAALPLIQTCIKLLPRLTSQRLGRLIDAISSFQELNNARVISVIAWTVAGYLLFVLSAYLVIVALDLPFGFAEIGWMRSTVFLLTTLPITVGGLGVREAGFAALLHGHGIDGPTAVAFPLILLGIQLVIGGFGGIVEFSRALQRKKFTGGEHG